MLTIGDLVADWIDYYGVQPSGADIGAPIKLDEWQRDLLREMYRFHPDRTWVYRNTTFSGPRNIAKSTLAAAICLFETSPERGLIAPKVMAAANNRQQAGIIWGEKAVEMIRRSPALQEIFDYNTMTIKCEATGGWFRRTSAEGKGAFGKELTFHAKDETAEWTTKRLDLLAKALDTGHRKHPESRGFNVSTAGTDKRSYLGQVYDICMAFEDVHREPGLIVARDEGAKTLLWWYAVETSVDLSVTIPKDIIGALRPATPATWVTDDQLVADFTDPLLSQADKENQFGNRWVAVKNAWFESGEWEGLKGESEIPDGAKICVAVDASLWDDSTAVGWSWKKDADTPAVVRGRVFSTHEDRLKHELCVDEEGNIDLDRVFDFVTNELGKKYVIREIAYDPRYFEATAKDLRKLRYRAHAMEPKSRAYRDATQAFYQAVKTHDLEHDGDPVVSDHIRATGASRRSDGWWQIGRLVNNDRDIDATVALMLAYSRARSYARKGGSTISREEREAARARIKARREAESNGGT